MPSWLKTLSVQVMSTVQQHRSGPTSLVLACVGLMSASSGALASTLGTIEGPTGIFLVLSFASAIVCGLLGLLLGIGWIALQILRAEKRVIKLVGTGAFIAFVFALVCIIVFSLLQS